VLVLFFVCGGSLFYVLAARLGKSPGGAALAAAFLWMLFFIIPALYRGSILYNTKLSLLTRLVILLILVAVPTVFVFLGGKKLKKIEIFKILAVFELILFLLNGIQVSVLLASKHIPRNSESNYKTSFYISPDSPSPNIYWLFMDGMLGFKAMEYFFDDPQQEFETQLTERGFIGLYPNR
jgi:hypothetical protein